MKNRVAWGLALVVIGAVLASLALGGIMGGVVGYLIGMPYDHTPVTFDMFREIGNEMYGAAAGLLVGLLIGLAWSFVALTEHRRGEDA